MQGNILDPKIGQERLIGCLICTFYEKNTLNNTPFLVSSKKSLKSNCLGFQKEERTRLCLKKMLGKLRNLVLNGQTSSSQKSEKSPRKVCFFHVYLLFLPLAFCFTPQNVADVIFMVLRYMLDCISVNFWLEVK